MQASIVDSRTALASAFATCVALAFSAAGFAQERAPDDAAPAAPAPPRAPSAVEEIVITGSRIRRPEISADSPLSVVDADELARSGTVNVEDALRELPQALPGASPYVNNGNPGAATVNLRNLDDERTLVLVDGKRFVGYDSEGIVDVNTIPVPLLERIDVVTGGASAVYGSDAIAGVVNFVLRDDFEGAQLGGSHAITSRGDGQLWDVSLTLGRSFLGERANLALYGGYTERDAVSTAARPYSDPVLATQTALPGGSRADSNGAFFCFPQCRDPGNFGPTTFAAFTPTGDLEPQGMRRFNFNPYNLLQVPEKRGQALALGHVELSDQLTFYARGTFAQTRIDTEIAPSGTFFDPFDFPLTYPFWTAQSLRVFADRNADGALDQLEINGIPGFQPADFVGPNGEPGDQGDVGTLACPACAGNNLADAGEFIRAGFARRIVELGSRISHNRNLAYQVLAGFEGDVPWLDGWSWDLSYQYGRSELSRAYENDISNPRVQAMLDGCPPGSPAGCVAGNLFGDGNLSPEAPQFLRLDLGEEIETSQQVAAFSASGDLGAGLAIPGAGAIGAAFGLEWRREESASFPDRCFAEPGCSPGFGSAPPIRSHYDVREVFGELRVPLLEERRFAYELSFEAGVRYADYSTAGGVTAYKLGGSWAPAETLRLRAMFQRAVRAPNIFELAEPVRPSSSDVPGDPCAAYNETTGGTTVSAELRDLCVATGAPASAFTLRPSGDYTTAVPDAPEGVVNSFVGGNPQLGEERADTITAGVVYEPRWAPELSLQLDWYRIELRDAIDSLAASDVLPGCYDAAHNPRFDPRHVMCRLVARDPLSGSLFGGASIGVSEIARNISKREVEGVDVQARYERELGRFGALEVSFLSSLLLHNDRRVAATFPLVRCKGTYSDACSGANPGVRFVQRTIWSAGEFSVGYRWRFVRASAIGSEIACVEPFCSISDTHFLDLTVEWTPADARWLSGSRLVLEIENLFDEDPPLVGSFGDVTSGNTLPGLYDPLGRRITLSFTKRFGRR
jgi:outer membrane receptor protein involved in Fe transport